MNHHEQYKRTSAGSTSANAGRRARAGQHKEHRRANRAENVARHRELVSDAKKEFLSSRLADRGERLRKWKEEQRLKKKIEEQKKKPIFKVGIVHHKVYSPPFCNSFSKKTQAKHSKGPKRVLTKSFAPPNYTFTAPSGVIEIPMFGRIVGTSSNKSRWTRRMMMDRFEWKTAVVWSSKAFSSHDFRQHLSSTDERTEKDNVKDNSSSKLADFVNPQIVKLLDVRVATPRLGVSLSASFSSDVSDNQKQDGTREELMNKTRLRPSSDISDRFSGNNSCLSKSSQEVNRSDAVSLRKIPVAAAARAFNNSNENFGRSLPQTYNYDSNDNFFEPYDAMRNITVRSVRKCLNFETESSDECENTNTA